MTGAVFAAGYFFLWVIGFLILILLGLLVYDKRYKQKPPGEEGKARHGFHPTPEVFIDPKDGLRYRVYYNPHTGERDYIQE